MLFQMLLDGFKKVEELGLEVAVTERALVRALSVQSGLSQKKGFESLYTHLWQAHTNLERSAKARSRAMWRATPAAMALRRPCECRVRKRGREAARTRSRRS